jgi:siroheme synthase
MKTVSGTLKLVVVVAIGVTAIFAFQAFAKKPASMKEASHTLTFKDRKLKKADFAELKKLLDDNEAIYCITFRKNANETPQNTDNGGCTEAGSTAVDDAKREMVPVCGGAHVTQRAGFSTLAQLSAVDKAFNP